VLIGMVVMLVGLLSALVFVLVSNIFDFLTPQLRSNLVWKAEHGVAEISKTVELGVAAEEPALIADGVRSYLADRDVLGVIVVGGRGQILLQRGQERLDPEEVFHGEPEKVHDRDARLVAWRPVEIEGMKIGRVGLAISKQQLQAGMHLRRQILLVGLGGALLALIATLAFVSFYIGPLLRITEDALHRLERTTEVAVESARLKSQFLANMSHEIRTPINGVLGITRLMLELPLEGKLRRYADALEASGRSLSIIINDILDFSKIEAGKYEIQRVEFDPTTVTQEVAETLSASAYAKRIDLVCRVAPDVPSRLAADPDRYRQILTNLVGNAVKFTQRGEVFIDVSTRPGQSSNEVLLRAEVRDTGIGIDDAAKGKVFDAFWQHDGSAARSYGGTGLGLAISKRLVEMMGGEIGFVSALGVGSRFHFTLPCLLTSEAATSRQPAEASGRRALIVDASASWSDVLSERLTTWGMFCAVESSGVRALEALRAASSRGEPFDIALVASQTEDLRGDELLQCIAAEPALATTRLVLIGHLGAAGATAELPDTVVAQLAKPMRASQLRDCIVSALRDRVAAPVRAGRELDTAACSPPHVLLVEDNEVNQLVAGEYLAQFGYQVDVARDGVEAVEAVQRREYVAVIMDCQMPIMDGYQATREIRRREAPGKRLPIIALTAHAMIGEREKVLAAGMDDYLIKPVDPVALRNALAQATAARTEPGSSAGRELEARTGGAPVGRTSGAPLSSEAELDAKVERFTELCELFLEIIPDQIEELERAITAGQADEVSARAHRLKSGTLTIGARRMASIAAEIEGRALLGRLSQAPKQLAELRQRFLVVSAQLRDEITHDCHLPGVNGADDGESKAP
jgi:signal transduction histidine kinase/DNA-binding response OmpR family regulator